jgi:hypothetical protein
MDNYMSSPTVLDCIFSGNTADGGGGMHNFASFAVVDGCRFSTNIASIQYGGGGMHNYGGAPMIMNCQFSGNTSIRAGGGMLNLISDAEIVNCLFIDNTAELGGGMRNETSSPAVSNCTFANNFVYNSGGAVHNVYSGTDPTFANCIFWNNDATYVVSVLDQAGAAATVTYSNVEGGWDGNGAETETNMCVDPQFIEDCYRLTEASSCVDAGNNGAVPEGVETDLDGNERITSVAVDMGAYECQTNAEPSCPADLTGDDVVNVSDLLALFAAWGTDGGPADIDADGFVDVADLMLMLQAFGPCS